MLVVLVVVDVIADVVEQRGIGEYLSLLGRTAQTRANRVEQLQREPLHPRRVRLLVVGPLGQLPDGALSCFTGICRRWRHPCRLEKYSLPNAISRDDEPAHIETREHFSGDGKSGNDDIGAGRSQSRNSLPLAG